MVQLGRYCRYGYLERHRTVLAYSRTKAILGNYRYAPKIKAYRWIIRFHNGFLHTNALGKVIFYQIDMSRVFRELIMVNKQYAIYQTRLATTGPGGLVMASLSRWGRPT